MGCVAALSVSSQYSSATPAAAYSTVSCSNRALAKNTVSATQNANMVFVLYIESVHASSARAERSLGIALEGLSPTSDYRRPALARLPQHGAA